MQHTYMQWKIKYDFDQINSGKNVQKCKCMF